MLIIPLINFAQAPPLGTAADFVLFTSVGAVSNIGTTDRAKCLTHLTGNVGFQTGSITGFANVNGLIHSGDGASNACAAILLIAYNFLAVTALLLLDQQRLYSPTQNILQYSLQMGLLPMTFSHKFRVMLEETQHHLLITILYWCQMEFTTLMEQL